MILLDSNILIYIGNGMLSPIDVAQHDVSYPSVVRIELLGYNKITADQIQAISRVFTQSLEVPLSPAIIDRAVAIRQSHTKPLSLGDTIIAATALETDAELWTANTDDFAGIDGLKLYNPLHGGFLQQ